MSAAFDPVSLGIMWSRLINIAEECWITIWRTAFSLIIGEAQDFGCELFDPDAHSIAHSPRSMHALATRSPRGHAEAMCRPTIVPTKAAGSVYLGFTRGSST